MKPPLLLVLAGWLSARFRNLSGRLAPATIDIETVDRCDTILGGPQGFERFGQADTEGAYHPGGDDGHAPICHVSSVKSHGKGGFSPCAITIAFSIEASY